MNVELPVLCRPVRLITRLLVETSFSFFPFPSSYCLNGAIVYCLIAIYHFGELTRVQQMQGDLT